MFEIFDNHGRTADRYLILITNPDRDLPGHKAYYDVTTDGHADPQSIWMHGCEWTEEEANKIRRDPQWSKLPWRRLPAEIIGNLLDELDGSQAK